MKNLKFGFFHCIDLVFLTSVVHLFDSFTPTPSGMWFQSTLQYSSKNATFYFLCSCYWERKCCGIQEGIKLQIAVFFPETIHTCFPESAQQAGCCFNTRAEGRQHTPSINHCASVMHLCGCAISLFQIPSIPLNKKVYPFPLPISSGLGWSQTKSFRILESADFSLQILTANP